MSKKKDLAKLVKRAQKGDPEAFGQIYEQFYDSIYSYVYRLVGKPADAEDVAAGVFLDLLEKIDRFSWSGAGFEAWLFRMARNDAIDYFRREKRRVMETGFTKAVETPARDRVERLAEAAWQQRDLLRAIRRLPEEQQQVVLLKLLVNFSNKQVGEVLSKSEGAVKALQYRALKALRKIMEEKEGDQLG